MISSALIFVRLELFGYMFYVQHVHTLTRFPLSQLTSNHFINYKRGTSFYKPSRTDGFMDYFCIKKSYKKLFLFLNFLHLQHDSQYFWFHKIVFVVLTYESQLISVHSVCLVT